MPELHHASAGSGPPLIILHGLFGSGKNWHSFMRRFAQRFEVFCVDLRNHGQSFHADEMDYPLMADDVARLVDGLGLARCRVLGHSMGGKVAMTLAMRRPDLLERMIVADIAPLAYAHHFDDVIEPILALPLDELSSRAQVDEALRADITEDALRAFLLSNLVREGDGWRWRVNWRAIRACMPRITGFDAPAADWVTDLPTRFIRGADSDYVDDAGLAVIERHFSHYRVDTIDGAGHWLHADRPAEFSGLVLDFLA